ncbi:MAG TPA: tetratricopeptide repeat protein [Chloroflexota bacterium]|nr:tetratricopeptide repeat protein [Chloroflexota bacterium]
MAFLTERTLMKVRALCLVAGTIILGGCSTQAAGKPSPTATAPASPPTPGSTAASNPTGAATTSSPTAVVVASGDPFQTGMTYLRRRQYSAAAVQFRRAITAHQHLAESYAGLGGAEMGQSRFSSAYTAYQHAASLKPTTQLYLYETAYAALYAQNFRQSVVYTTRLLRLNPYSVAAYHLQMQAYSRLYQPKMALIDAKRIVRLKPKNAEAYDDLGIALANTQHDEAALNAFSTAIRLDPHRYNYFSNRAVVEHLLKDKAAAIADFAEAEKLAPDAKTKSTFAAIVAELKKTH